jgi:predicted permease
MIAGMRDVGLAFRSLRRDRGAMAVAVLSLAIGIAANTTVFSLVQAIEFPRLIYPQASRIVFLESRHDARGLVGMPVSAPDAADIAAGTMTLRQIAIAADQTSIVGEGAGRRRVSGRRVTPAFFDVLGTAPARGRAIAAGDAPGVVVLGDDLWRSQFGADPDVVGRSLRLDGGVVIVVGVMPPRFDADADFWTPLESLSGFARDDRQLSVFARLAPGASIDAATRELESISRRLAVEHPPTNHGWSTFPVPLARLHGRDSHGAFLLLQAAVGAVLLIACANIANILLARATRRSHEMAVRLSLGATRGRLLRLLITESLVLAAIGGALGVALSLWGIRLARAIGGFPDVIDPSPNAIVLGFTVALSVLTGLICGILPALRASRTAPGMALSAEGGRGGSGSRGRLRAVLVAVQVACAVVLGTGGALILQSLANRQRVDLGFEPRGAVRADLMLAGARYDTPAAIAAAAADLFERLAARPGVAAAGAITFALPTPAGGQRPILVAGSDAALNPSVRRGVEAITPGYVEAIGVPLREGRRFTAADRAGAAPVALVNAELVRHLWPGRSPLGASLRLGDDGSAPIVTVVGVVGTVRRSPMHDVPVARVYVPFAQHPNPSLSIVVRAAGGEAPAADALRAVVAATDPALMIERLTTVEQDLAQFIAPLRLMSWLLGAFALTALLLTALGVFGSMSYNVMQRRRELAIRTALGAGRGALVRLVVRQAALLTIAGTIPGVAISFIAARWLRSFLFGVAPIDAGTTAGVIALLAIASLAACWRPARAAASADPMTILRD